MVYVLIRYSVVRERAKVAWELSQATFIVGYGDTPQYHFYPISIAPLVYIVNTSGSPFVISMVCSK